MRTTIWIPDDLVDGIKEAAWKSKKSVSGYLVQLHKDSGKERLPVGAHIPDCSGSIPGPASKPPITGKERCSLCHGTGRLIPTHDVEEYYKDDKKPQNSSFMPTGSGGPKKAKADFSSRERKPVSEMKSALYNPVEGEER